jgi:hypothetical protein
MKEINGKGKQSIEKECKKKELGACTRNYRLEQ